MKQIIVVEKPPVYDRCVERFGAAAIVGHSIVWSWGGVIYNPTDCDIPREILAHEAVHGERQGVEEAKIQKWWNLYLLDPVFRYEEELAAHRVEWRTYMRARPGKNCGPMLDAISARLASELYGLNCTASEARIAILAK